MNFCMYPVSLVQIRIRDKNLCYSLALTIMLHSYWGIFSLAVSCGCDMVKTPCLRMSELAKAWKLPLDRGS